MPSRLFDLTDANPFRSRTETLTTMRFNSGLLTRIGRSRGWSSPPEAVRPGGRRQSPQAAPAAAPRSAPRPGHDGAGRAEGGAASSEGHRHCRGLFDRLDSRPGHRRADRGQLQGGRRRDGGAGALCARSPPARGGAPAGAGHARARSRAGGERQSHCPALRGPRPAGNRDARAGGDEPNRRGGARRDRRRRSRRHRERERRSSNTRRSRRRCPGAPER